MKGGGRGWLSQSLSLILWYKVGQQGGWTTCWTAQSSVLVYLYTIGQIWPAHSVCLLVVDEDRDVLCSRGLMLMLCSRGLVGIGPIWVQLTQSRPQAPPVPQHLVTS